MASPLTLYLLTLDPTHITGLEPVQATIRSDGEAHGDPEAFTVVVEGLDEYVTKADWDRVWRDRVKPVQDSLWEGRGMRPQGKRSVGLKRLERSISAYGEMVRDGLSEQRMITRSDGRRDQELIRRDLQDLRRLLEPEAE